MRKIAVVTTTRAEYGLLSPLIRRIMRESGLELDLIVSGTHLSERHGYTIDEILRDEVPVTHEVQILSEDNSPYGISETMANAIKGFARCFRDDRPDIVVLLGDRTEMLGVAAAAMSEKIPIAHLNGGEVTKGAVDDCVRNSITKMSYLHFTGTEVYRKRVVQMGEAPNRVYNVGALCVENIKNLEYMPEFSLRTDVGIPLESKYAVVTFHPVTNEHDTVVQQINELISAMIDRSNIFYVITAANADTGGDKANSVLSDYANTHANALFVNSLGMKRYLSALKYASFVLGNSSSGMSEAPIIGTPTVNIGDRQKGRLVAETVICCEPVRGSITEAIDRALDMKHKPSNMYGDGNTSERIVDIIKKTLERGIELKKGFYDISF